MANRDRVIRKQASHDILRILFRSVRGIAISNSSKEKSEKSVSDGDMSLTYGEITPQSFVQLLKDSLVALAKNRGKAGSSSGL